MPGKIQISPRQFMILVLLYSVGTVILHTPSPLAAFAKQDAWLAAILGTAAGLMLVWLYIKVAHLFPDLTLDQIIERVFGKWIGKLINFSFFFFLITTGAGNLFHVSNFIKTYWMPETPSVALIILYVTIVIGAARLGVEAFSRTAELLFVPFLILLITFIVVVAPQIKVSHIQPVLDSGVTPIIRASLFYVSVFSFSPVKFLMIFPFVNNRKAAGKAFYIGTCLGGFLLIIIILLNILVLGPAIMASNSAPTYALAKKINVGDFLTRIEAIIAFIWLISTFIRGVMYFHVSLAVFAGLFGIQNARPLSAPLGMFMVAVSVVIAPSDHYIAAFLKDTQFFYAGTFGLVLPLLLLGFAKIRNVFGIPTSK
ncbi:endospore germination permease [Bacillus sp. 3255]|uniref:GerAB/ArcD/ProY family transporter n=1 Tax=Bacillus sp. 3255 TaxID=2817904 RepID=UPI0028546ADD|nr:endospore germination permease [Bacillus sp. 3255]MDR6882468.1 spore germination protein KB [Bacillus sp. 3255]